MHRLWSQDELDRERPALQDNREFHRHSYVILKSLPVLQCENCTKYLIEDAVLSRVDEILAGISDAAELEVIRYAA